MKKKYNLKLPNDYKHFLLAYNGGKVRENNFYKFFDTFLEEEIDDITIYYFYNLQSIEKDFGYLKDKFIKLAEVNIPGLNLIMSLNLEDHGYIYLEHEWEKEEEYENRIDRKCIVLDAIKKGDAIYDKVENKAFIETITKRYKFLNDENIVVKVGITQYKGGHYHPNFSKVAVATASNINVKGTRNWANESDYMLATKQISDNLGISVPDLRHMIKELKLVWHHNENLKTMELLPFGIHDALKHQGSVGIIDKLKEISSRTNISFDTLKQTWQNKVLIKEL